MREIPRTLRPQCLATITSGTVLMPTVREERTGMSGDLHQNKISPKLETLILPSAHAIVSFPRSSLFLNHVIVQGCDTYKSVIVTALLSTINFPHLIPMRYVFLPSRFVRLLAALREVLKCCVIWLFLDWKKANCKEKRLCEELSSFPHTTQICRY